MHLQLRAGETIILMLTRETRAFSLKSHYKGLLSHPPNILDVPVALRECSLSRLTSEVHLMVSSVPCVASFVEHGFRAQTRFL